MRPSSILGYRGGHFRGTGVLLVALTSCLVAVSEPITSPSRRFKDGEQQHAPCAPTFSEGEPRGQLDPTRGPDRRGPTAEGYAAASDISQSPSVPTPSARAPAQEGEDAACSCTDVRPYGSAIPCRKQRMLGKCRADWMLAVDGLPEGFCQTTCGRCRCPGMPMERPPAPSTPAQFTPDGHCLCTDIAPPHRPFSCQQQAGFGKCEADWMVSTLNLREGFCQITCGRCPCELPQIVKKRGERVAGGDAACEDDSASLQAPAAVDGPAQKAEETEDDAVFTEAPAGLATPSELLRSPAAEPSPEAATPAEPSSQTDASLQPDAPDLGITSYERPTQRPRGVEASADDSAEGEGEGRPEGADNGDSTAAGDGGEGGGAIGGSEECSTLLEILERAPGFPFVDFIRLVKVADLEPLLDSADVSLTLFVPVSGGVEAATAQLGITVDGLLQQPALARRLVANQILPDPRPLLDLLTAAGPVQTLAAGPNSTLLAEVDELQYVPGVTEAPGVLIRAAGNEAVVIQADIPACGGSLLHLIDELLLPLPASQSAFPPPMAVSIEPPGPSPCNTSVLQLLRSRPGTQLMADLVVAAGLGDVLGSPSFEATLLAANARGINRTLEPLGVLPQQLLREQPALLASVLGLHVIPQVLTSSELRDGQVLETLLNANSVQVVRSQQPGDGIRLLVLAASAGGEGGAGPARIIVPDLQACGSVVHIIDRLLLPFVEPPSPPAAAPDTLLTAAAGRRLLGKPLEAAAAGLGTLAGRPAAAQRDGRQAGRSGSGRSVLQMGAAELLPAGGEAVLSGEALAENAADLPATDEGATPGPAECLLGDRLCSDLLQDIAATEGALQEASGAGDDAAEGEAAAPDSSSDAPVGRRRLQHGGGANAASLALARSLWQALLPRWPGGERRQLLNSDEAVPWPTGAPASEDGEEAGTRQQQRPCRPLRSAVAARPELQFLSRAIETAEVAEELSSELLSITLLAPTDGAFLNAIPLEALEALLASNRSADSSLLRNLLLFHSIPAALTETELLEAQLVPTMLTRWIAPSTRQEEWLLVERPAAPSNSTRILSGRSAAQLVQADLPACSSVLHLVDAVLLPHPPKPPPQPPASEASDEQPPHHAPSPPLRPSGGKPAPSAGAAGSANPLPRTADDARPHPQLLLPLPPSADPASRAAEPGLEAPPPQMEVVDGGIEGVAPVGAGAQSGRARSASQPPRVGNDA